MYWKKAGKENTQKTLRVAAEATKERGIKDIVIASNSGATVKKFLDINQDSQTNNTVCVTHHVGFKEPGKDEMPKKTRAELAGRGVKVLTTTHALTGVARSIKNDFGGLYPAEIMAYTLRMLGQGVKVSVEISVMALDAGLIPYGQEIIAVGGTGKGADTACIISPGHSNQVFETKILEILCKPRK